MSSSHKVIREEAVRGFQVALFAILSIRQRQVVASLIVIEKRSLQYLRAAILFYLSTISSLDYERFMQLHLQTRLLPYDHECSLYGKRSSPEKVSKI
jgi:hypothetical protein